MMIEFIYGFFDILAAVMSWLGLLGLLVVCGLCIKKYI